MSVLKTTPMKEILLRGNGKIARTAIKLGSLLIEERSEAQHPTNNRTVLPSSVAVLGNYLPRQCGIATFTADLCDAISAEFGTTELLALPVNDTEEGYHYPERVRFELSEGNLSSYRQAAD